MTLTIGTVKHLRHSSSTAESTAQLKVTGLLCGIIARRFASVEDHAMKLAEWYELSSITGPDTKLITVFLDSEEIDGWISQLAQEASINTYFISSSNLKVSENSQFANLCDTLHRILWVQEQPNCSCHHTISSVPIHIVSLAIMYMAI